MAKRTLSEVEKFFIERNMEKGIDWLVEHIGVGSKTLVSNYYEKIKEKPVDSFSRQDGIVMMTSVQSERDDVRVPVTPPVPCHIHKIKK
jgi:hypothetical protein